jgi:hypothetical protein
MLLANKIRVKMTTQAELSHAMTRRVDSQQFPGNFEPSNPGNLTSLF